MKSNGFISGSRPLKNIHETHMEAALNLARRGLGNVWPNPSVGCVIVKNNKVIGRGWTQSGGRPHAETEAIRKAGRTGALGSTVYVTLEPCNHHGQTPPCTEALINAGVKRVIIATLDRDKRVAGCGFKRLEKAGISVEVGVCKSEANKINRGFFSRIERQKPLVTLKLATTLDGKIATNNGKSRWITGEYARKIAHNLRAIHDAVMIGSGTVIADDPLLTCRLPGLENKNKLRIVVDGRLRIPVDSKLVQSAKELPVLIFTRSGSIEKHKKMKKLESFGVEIVVYEDYGMHIDMKKVMIEISSRGITRLLIEGGGILSASLLADDLIDEVAWFRAPSIMGNDGLPAIDGLDVYKLEQMAMFSRESITNLGDDSLEVLVKKVK